MNTVSVNQDKCIGCNKCVKLCPMKILELDGNRKIVVTDETICDAAYGCIRVCPVGAISEKTI